MLVGLIDWKLEVQQAIDLPNFGSRTSSTTTVREGHCPDGARKRARRRAVTTWPSPTLRAGCTGSCLAARVRSGEPGAFSRARGKGRWAGGADPRHKGTARGSEEQPLNARPSGRRSFLVLSAVLVAVCFE